jgi:DNA-binding transcriptional ArsR family regulator
MANQLSALPEVFHALADPTRCAIVSRLVRGPESVTTLAAPFQMALPSFMKHIAVLERSGLVRSHKLGRVRTCELVPKRLSQAEQWLAQQRKLWEARSDRMAALAEQIHQKESSHVKPNAS